jgi:tetratricopeptide (TPR) repeat protein
MAGDTGPALRTAGTVALAQAAEITSSDMLLLQGLSALAQRQYQTACERLGKLVQLDSLNFAAWLGMGDCHAFDTLVVPDSTSPSRWRFRSSYHAAIQAYQTALELAPSFNFAMIGSGASRLHGLLLLDPSLPPRGASADGEQYAAFPAVSSGSDTLRFIPYRLRDMLAGRPGSPAEYAAGTMRVREISLTVARDWVAAFPDNAEALEAYALALESVDAIRADRPGNPSALAVAERALRSATDQAQRFRIANMRLRFLLKTEDYGGVTRLADSLLAAIGTPDTGQAVPLAAVAALRGRIHRTAELLVLELPRTQERLGAVPASIVEDYLRLRGYAAFGWPADSLRVLWRRIEEGIRAGVPPHQQETLLAQLNRRAAYLAFPVIGITTLHRPGPLADWLSLLQAAQWRGDTAAVRAGVAQRQASFLDVGPQPVTIDIRLHVALLSLAIGDTASAIRTLDSVLNHLGLAHPRVTADESQAASLVRMMPPRAELAARANDEVAMRRWAHAVRQLWSEGDAHARSVAQAAAKLRVNR